MAIISQETWDNLPEEEKEKLCQNYSEDYDAETRVILDDIFGKHNLQPKYKIRTWEDVEKLLPEDGFCVGKFEKYADNPKVTLKCQATLRIAKLIELGYGGIVSDEEWEERINEGTGFYTIAYSPLYKSFHIRVESCNKQFIAFHTRQQAEEFMSYPDNVELLAAYHVVC